MERMKNTVLDGVYAASASPGGGGAVTGLLGAAVTLTTA